MFEHQSNDAAYHGSRLRGAGHEKLGVTVVKLWMVFGEAIVLIHDPSQAAAGRHDFRLDEPLDRWTRRGERRQIDAVSTIYEDFSLDVSGEVKETYYPTLVGAKQLHQEGIDGYGIAIAVLDTGLWKKTSVQDNANGDLRILAQYDVIRDREEPDFYEENDDYDDDVEDENGHGTHLTNIMVSSDQTEAGHYQGVAPNADFVTVKAFNKNGTGTYLDVIRGIDGVIQHRDDYGIQVLNLSFSAPARSHYWEDPLNQAVMAAWHAGIVVVASAGNTGPEPMTIGVFEQQLSLEQLSFRANEHQLVGESGVGKIDQTFRFGLAGAGSFSCSGLFSLRHHAA